MRGVKLYIGEAKGRGKYTEGGRDGAMEDGEAEESSGAAG